MYSCVPVSKLDLTLLKTLFQILLWIQPTFLSMRGSCSFCWMQGIIDMSKGELCCAPLSPIKTFQNMIERIPDAAQSLTLNPCHGWDELNKTLYGFEYWDLLKTFQAYGFYPFWLFHTQIFQSHSSLHFPLLEKLGRVISVVCREVFPACFYILQLVFLHLHVLFAYVQCVWTGGSASCLVLTTIQCVTAFSSRPCQNSQPVCTCCRDYCLGAQMLCFSHSPAFII